MADAPYSEGTDRERPAPWERQGGEPEVAWSHFKAYLEQCPPRSLERLARERGVGYVHFRKLSSEWRWVERVAAWDRATGRAEAEVALEEVRVRSRLRISDLDLMADVAISRLLEVLESLKSKAGDRRPEDVLTASQAARMLIDGIKVEQLLLGRATERIERDGGQGSDEPDIDWSKYSVEELWQLKELLAKGRPD